MNKFSPEEIALCKKIAEKHRKKIDYGVWYTWGDYSPIISSGSLSQVEQKEAIPLWTISDCLEFLREKDSYLHFEYYEIKCEVTAFVKNIDSTIIGKGETPLEACLKTVLAILEESS